MSLLRCVYVKELLSDKELFSGEALRVAYVHADVGAMISGF